MAVESYYAPGWTRDEKANLTGFEQGWRKVHKQFPEDPEAATFYALAHMATADPEDKSYSKQKRAAAISRQVLDQIPDHPGAHHYIIHAKDYPPLAEKASEVARSYGEIAPAVPHALHMPSHIFTRLGLWPQSIEMNKRSADAALERSPNRFNSMYGIARAAELEGNSSKAARYYRKLVEQTTPDAERERLQRARAFLAANKE